MITTIIIIYGGLSFGAIISGDFPPKWEHVLYILCFEAIRSVPKDSLHLLNRASQQNIMCSTSASQNRQSHFVVFPVSYLWQKMLMIIYPRVTLDQTNYGFRIFCIKAVFPDEHLGFFSPLPIVENILKSVSTVFLQLVQEALIC